MYVFGLNFFFYCSSVSVDAVTRFVPSNTYVTIVSVSVIIHTCHTCATQSDRFTEPGKSCLSVSFSLNGWYFQTVTECRAGQY